MKQLNKIFDLIINENAILWLGSGCSKIAGYPNVSELIEEIISSLEQDEKNEIINNFDKSNLQIISEEYINRYRNRKILLDIIIKNYSKKVNLNLKYHKILTLVPQIKTIISTNYDTILEEIYKDKCVVIRNNKDINKLNEYNKTEIFKIHGDVINPESIVISDSDYIKFVKNELDNIFLNIIKERIAKKTIIFIGYSLNDFNIKLIIDRLQLGNKKHYFLSPDINEKVKPNKKYKLIEIKSNFETFTELLLKYIQDNIFNNTASISNSNSFSEFLNTHNISPQLIGENNNIRLTGLKFNEKPKFDLISNNQIILNKIESFMNGDYPELVIKKNEDFNFKINDISIHKKHTNLDLRIIKKPNLITQLDIYSNGKLLIKNVDCALFKFTENIKVEFRIKSLIVSIVKNINDINKYNFNFKLDSNCLSIADEKDTYKILKKIIGNEDLDIHILNYSVIKIKAMNDHKIQKECDNYINYLKNLELIEEYFNTKVNINNREEINNLNYNNLIKIIDIINNNNINIHMNENWEAKLDETTSNKNIHTLKKEITNQHSIKIKSALNNTIKIHDTSIKISGSYSLIILDPIYNFNKIEKKKIIIKSKSKQANVDFSETKIQII